MSKLRGKFSAKIIAAIAVLLAVIIAVGSALGILFLESCRGYEDPSGKLTQQTVLQDRAWGRIWEVEEYFRSTQWGEDPYYFAHSFDKTNTNFFFRLYDENGKKVLENYWTEDAIYTFEETLNLSWEVEKTETYRGDIFTWDVDNWNEDEQVYEYRDVSGKILYRYDEQGGLWDVETQNWGSWDYDGEKTVVTVWTTQTQELTIKGGVAADLHADDEFTICMALVDWLVPMRHGLIAAAVIAALIALSCMIFLMWAVGHKDGVEGIYLAPWHRIPLDLTAVLWILLVAGCILVRDLLTWQLSQLDAVLLTLGALAIIAVLILAMYAVLTLTVRFKAGKWWRNTILWRVLRWGWKWTRRLLRVLPLVWKTAIVCGLVVFVDFFAMFVFGYGVDEAQVVFWLLEVMVLVPLVIYIAWQLRVLQKSGEAMAAGNLSVRTDTSRLILEFKQHGENLNRIVDGMNAAVDARMRSERLKTELITNVSHDLKTPLTSIVNYVDLMEQLPDLQPETAREHLAVLRRQSARLKKLTEDLIEASKASSGAMPVNPAPVNLHELLRQAAGEYQEKLAQADLTLMLDLPPYCTVLADGRLLWRVLDNLLNNCCKYAMPGTRVYLKVTTGQSRAAIFVKNVSREVLNMDGAMLMERFVRADPARSTEGSGLGLSIARSLTELQQGTFGLQIDGDLFKVELTLPLVRGQGAEDKPEV